MKVRFSLQSDGSFTGVDDQIHGVKFSVEELRAWLKRHFDRNRVILVDVTISESAATPVQHKTEKTDANS